jgi:ABC-type nitrate/sulfonate/bicarbonate transport system substrate-binding protein
MERSGMRPFIMPMSLVLIMLGVNAGAQGKPEKEKIRIGYAARAVTHAIPYLANEAGLFRDEGLQVEVVRTAGAVSPMALISGDTDFATMSAFLLIRCLFGTKKWSCLAG